MPFLLPHGPVALDALQFVEGPFQRVFNGGKKFKMGKGQAGDEQFAGQGICCITSTCGRLTIGRGHRGLTIPFPYLYDFTVETRLFLQPVVRSMGRVIERACHRRPLPNIIYLADFTVYIMNFLSIIERKRCIFIWHFYKKSILQ